MGKDYVKDHHKSIAYKTIECKEEIGDEDSQIMMRLKKLLKKIF